MPAFIKCIKWYYSFYFQFSCLGLSWLLWKLANIFFSCRNISKPFFCKLFYFFNRYISRHNQYGIIRTIMFKKEIFYIIKLCIFNMRKFFADRHPAIRMDLISKLSHLMPNITIRLIEIMFFKLFANNFALHIQTFFTKRKR